MSIQSLKFNTYKEVEHFNMEEYLNLLLIPFKVLPAEIGKTLKAYYPEYISKLNLNTVTKIQSKLNKDEVESAKLTYIIQYLKGGILILGDTLIEDIFLPLDTSYDRTITFQEHLLNNSNTLSDKMYYSPYGETVKEESYILMSNLTEVIDGYSLILYESLRGGDSTVLGKSYNDSLVFTTDVDKLTVAATLIKVNI